METSLETPIYTDYALTQHTSFAVPAIAAHFGSFQSVAELQQLIKTPLWKANKAIILGEGTNTLFVNDYAGLVLINKIKGITKVREDSEHVWLEIGAGESWHQFVEYCLKHHYAGVENLSLIPGNLGAAPIQNIGAYGVELSEVFEELQAVSVVDGKIRNFSLAECEFGYRDSVFKNSLKNKYIITQVTLRLDKQPTFNISYGQIAATLEEMDIHELSIQAISKAVCAIRRSKLPDPQIIPNAGSFFKNPFVTWDQLAQIAQIHEDVPHFHHDETFVKIPAAWLIERCGWKGKHVGRAGVHDKQALVLVNLGGATGAEIYELAKQIQQDVQKHFGVLLETEVSIIS